MDVRQAVETLLVACACLWVAVALWPAGSFKAAALLGQIASLVLLAALGTGTSRTSAAADEAEAEAGAATEGKPTARASWLPARWHEVARSCADDGLVYAVLPSMASLSLVLSGGSEDGTYATLIFWVSTACSARALLPERSVAVDVALAAATTGVWRAEAEAGANGAAGAAGEAGRGLDAALVGAAFAHALLALLLHRALVGVWTQAFQKSFTIGEALAVMQGLALLGADFASLSADALLVGIGLEGLGLEGLGLEGLGLEGLGLEGLGGPVTLVRSGARAPVLVAIQGGLLGVLLLPVVLAGFFRRHAVLVNETADVDARTESVSSATFRRRVSSHSLARAVVDWSSPTHSAASVAGFYACAAAWLGGAVSLWVGLLLGQHPVAFVRDYTFSRQEHVQLLLFWAGCLAAGLPVIHVVGSRAGWPLIITRKLYHVLAICMFGPAVARAPRFLALSLAISGALFVLVECVRICRVPPLGNWLHAFLRSYTDSRDEGTTILTHIYLLMGVAVPLWVFSSADSHLHSHSHSQAQPEPGTAAAAAAAAAYSVAPLGGLAILGGGDAAGAIVGSQLGRVKWPGGLKTLEGTLAAIVATLAVTLALAPAPPEGAKLDYAGIVAATLLTCLVEAFTKQIDNLVLPVLFSALLALPPMWS